MSVAYKTVQWTGHKKVYDLVLAGSIAAYITVFVLVSKLAFRPPSAFSDEIILMRALGTCAILLLHIVLCIGPLARLDRRFLVLLYNRRHLGVATFLVGLAHAVLAVGFYHGFGRLSPFLSLLISNTQYGSVTAFPFEALGVVGLLILFLMAATSHDFWLKNLSPRVWKSLHMLVYLAYAAIILHVALGALQSERHGLYTIVLVTGVLIVSLLHIAAAWEQHRLAQCTKTIEPGERWVDVADVDDIHDGRAATACLPGGKRIAVFRNDDTLSAVSNTCVHQGGPLGEGKIINGCITCPWHGYQYRPGDGCSPPPFTEKLPTYRVRVVGRRVQVDPEALPPGTPVTPARLQDMPQEVA